jgi:hypothetical protein
MHTGLWLLCEPSMDFLNQSLDKHTHFVNVHAEGFTVNILTGSRYFQTFKYVKGFMDLPNPGNPGRTS